MVSSDKSKGAFKPKTQFIHEEVEDEFIPD